jgi:hypothetical protein
MKLSVPSFGGSIALALFTFSAAAPQATAAAIFDTLSLTYAGDTALATFGPLAASFSTGSTAVTLTDVQLSIEATNPSDGDTFLIGLFPDTGTTYPYFAGPLVTITGVADSSLTGAFADYDYALGPVALAANTRYWIALNTTNASSVEWSDTGSQGVGSESEYFLADSNVSANDPFGPFQMQVNAEEATPEPASGSLILSLAVMFGLCAAVVKARRRQRIVAD